MLSVYSFLARAIRPPLQAPLGSRIGIAVLAGVVCLAPVVAMGATSVLVNGVTHSVTNAGDSVSGANTAGGNTVTVQDGSGPNPGSIYANAPSGTMENNILKIEGGEPGGASSTSAYSIAGSHEGDGHGKAGDAKTSKVVMTGGKVDFLGASGIYVWGGQSETGSAIDNGVEISGGLVNGQVTIYGGQSEFINGAATGNFVTISGGTVSLDRFRGIFGGLSDGNANENTVTISGGSVSMGSVAGGQASGGSANKNKVFIISANNLTKVEINSIDGGSTYSNNGSPATFANENEIHVDFASAKVTGDVTGGDGWTDASRNVVEILSADEVKNVYGGYANLGEAVGNKVTLGTVNVLNDVVGGMTNVTGGSGKASGNTVNITGATQIAGKLYGGQSDDGTGDFSGNVLNIKAKGVTVGSVGHFAAYYFYLPADTGAGDTLLTVTGTADLTGATIGVGRMGNSALKVGDKVNLITAASVTAPASLTNSVSGMQGVSLLYDFGLSHTATTLDATVGNVKPSPVTKNITAAYATGMAASAMALDLTSGLGMDNAAFATVSAVEVEKGRVNAGLSAGSSNYGITPFAAASAGMLKSRVGDGVTTRGAAFMTGLARRFEFSAHDLLVGAFFEAGNARYTSRTSTDGVSLKGKGDSKYTGGGLLARLQLTDTALAGLYVEGSARVGHMRTSYKTNDVTDALGRHVDYSFGNTYYGAHFGLGYLRPLTERLEANVYGKYFWNHQNSKSLNILDDPWHFDSTDSHRTRLGARMNIQATSHVTPYVGLAWEHEFAGTTRAQAYGLEMPAAYARGSSGMGELGLNINVNSFNLEFNVQGYLGQKRGVMGNLSLGYEF